MFNLFKKKIALNLSDVINMVIVHEPIKIEFENYGKVSNRFPALEREKKQSNFYLNQFKKVA